MRRRIIVTQEDIDENKRIYREIVDNPTRYPNLNFFENKFQQTQTVGRNEQKHRQKLRDLGPDIVEASLTPTMDKFKKRNNAEREFTPLLGKMADSTVSRVTGHMGSSENPYSKKNDWLPCVKANYYREKCGDSNDKVKIPNNCRLSPGLNLIIPNNVKAPLRGSLKKQAIKSYRELEEQFKENETTKYWFDGECGDELETLFNNNENRVKFITPMTGGTQKKKRKKKKKQNNSRKKKKKH